MGTLYVSRICDKLTVSFKIAVVITLPVVFGSKLILRYLVIFFGILHSRSRHNYILSIVILNQVYCLLFYFLFLA